MNNSLKTLIDTLKAHLEEGSLIWHNPCLIKAQSNAVTGRAYQGVNQLVTAVVADVRGYQSPYWATFHQIRQQGGTLIEAKGQGVPIVFYNQVASKAEEDEQQERFVIRHSHVFNLDLVADIDTQKWQGDPTGQAYIAPDAEAIAETYRAREQIPVRHGLPAYAPALDCIYMPQSHEIASTDEYYSTYFHELAHSTGHPRRLGRFPTQAHRFASREEYSKEELVAEITAAMLCHGCGVSSQASIKNSAAYLQGWSRFVENEGDSFLSAVNQAYKARAFILAGEGDLAETGQ